MTRPPAVEYSQSADILARQRPETRAGGFARDSGAIAFYSRVNALLKPAMVVVDLGAGRGETFHAAGGGYIQALARLQGKVARVIGIDIDEAIADHPFLDERHVVPVGSPWPLADASVDMVVADWVFEHVSDPAHLQSELDRVLKPGGWVCARTPNAWGYVGLGARLLPNRMHTRVLGWLWPGRLAMDVFPTAYSLNSFTALRRAFPPARWEHFSYRTNPTPKYFGRSQALFGLIGAAQAIAPYVMKTDLCVLLRKRRGRLEPDSFARNRCER